MDQVPTTRQPFLTGILVASVPIALVLIVSGLRGGSPVAAARLIAPSVIAGIWIGVQASLAATRRNIWGYVWRFLLAWIVVFTLARIVAVP